VEILFIGGTGNISRDCVIAARESGHDVYTLTRGHSALASPVDPGHALVADASNEQQVRDAVAGRHFDVVIQWTAYVAAQVTLDVRLFADVGQYVFISSASAYEKPPSHWLITESTPLRNPFWQYSRDKIACERALMDAHEATGFPVTIIRPSLTYGVSQIPVAVGSWAKPYTIVERMRRGAPIIVPGDGTSIWTITHSTDFARGLTPLLGRREAIGEAFHITSDEALTWNQIYGALAEAAGVTLDVLHVPTDGLVAADPSLEGTLWGDKVNSTVFDNAKLRRLVPDFRALVPFAEGIRDTVAWFDEDARRREVDDAANALWDRLAVIYDDALARAARAEVVG
jgi:nucleoside-diphosphate-sugar epimerase